MNPSQSRKPISVADLMRRLPSQAEAALIVPRAHFPQRPAA
jgi:hypothetical protein